MGTKLVPIYYFFSFNLLTFAYNIYKVNNRMNKIRYFDHSATTYVKEEVIKEMIPYFGIEYGNPSSMYSLGRRANRAKEEARKKVEKLDIDLIICSPLLRT